MINLYLNLCLIKILFLGSFDIKYISARRGSRLLMVNGYTFSKNIASQSYYCSKKDRGCRARVKLDSNGKIINEENLNHDHPPPKYVVTSNGKYVKVSS